MELGAFSVSLAVKDIHASKAFYEQMGFETTGGILDQKWVILKNGSTVIGLFEGMFEGNLLTFNPGWNNDAKEVNPFTDIRDLAKELESKGVAFETPLDDSKEGPASFMIKDPDGNVILVDQHR